MRTQKAADPDTPPGRLIPDDAVDPIIEKLARKVSRLASEIKALKGEMNACSELLLVELKKLEAKAYRHAGVTAYIEREEKLRVECADETGEA